MISLDVLYIRSVEMLVSIFHIKIELNIILLFLYDETKIVFFYKLFFIISIGSMKIKF